MELKFRSAIALQKYKESFNRTFMELKYTYVPPADGSSEVLIVPLWN